MMYKGNSIYKSAGENKIISVNLNDYQYVDLIDDIVYETGFNRRGTLEEFVRYYPDLSIVSFNLFVVTNSVIPKAQIPDPWILLFSLTNNDFYFSDFVTGEQKPTGVLGMFNSGMLTQGMEYDGIQYNLSTSCIVTTTIVTNYKKVSMKNLIDPDGVCRGAPISRSYAVTKK